MKRHPTGAKGTTDWHPPGTRGGTTPQLREIQGKAIPHQRITMMSAKIIMIMSAKTNIIVTGGARQGARGTRHGRRQACHGKGGTGGVSKRGRRHRPPRRPGAWAARPWGQETAGRPVRQRAAQGQPGPGEGRRKAAPTLTQTRGKGESEEGGARTQGQRLRGSWPETPCHTDTARGGGRYRSTQACNAWARG